MTADLERIAREAGGRTGWQTIQRRSDPELADDEFVFDAEDLARFAAIVAADCAKIAEQSHPHDFAFIGQAIRQRFGA